MSVDRRTSALQLAALLLFVGIGVLLIPLLGFEDDELVFVNLFFHPNDAFSRLPLLHDYAVPALAASYVGALKAWLYSPLFVLLPMTVWLVRLPAVLLSGLTIILTGQLLKQISGPVAATVVVLLLATDATFLFIATFDWGPVVLQSLLLVTTLLLAMRWYRERNPRLLFLCGLTVGLALWDKAVFLWQLTGLIVAFLSVNFPLVRRLWTRSNLSLLSRGLLLGALPLIVANLGHHFATIRDNGHRTLNGFGAKAAFLQSALNGQAATTFFVENGRPEVDRIHRPLQSVGLWLVQTLGDSPSLWRFYPGLLVILLGTVLTKGTQRRWVLFFLISGTVGWLQAATTLHAGDMVHHDVLFWINWYAAIALSTSVLLTIPVRPVRIGTALLIGVASLRGLLVMGVGYGELVAHPGTPRWTDADVALARQLKQAHIKRVIAADWGLRNVIRARTDGAIEVDNQGPKLTLGNFDPKAFLSCRSDCAVVTHTENRNVFPSVPEVLASGLKGAGLGKSGTTILYDTHGVPSFEVFQLSRTGQSKLEATIH